MLLSSENLIFIRKNINKIFTQISFHIDKPPKDNNSTKSFLLKNQMCKAKPLIEKISSSSNHNNIQFAVI